ncbi:fibronectin type III domain-containing protein, partial [bacterium]|nr:fibronectin type III domain-containing protein [bacterium]
IVKVTGADYYISSDINGWPEYYGTATTGYTGVLVKFDRIRSGAENKYWDWTQNPQDKAIEIIALGGLGVGQRKVQTTYPGALIQYGLDQFYYPCLSNEPFYINDLDGCILFSGNQLALKTNQPPVININPEYTVDKNALLQITVCASDPDGDNIVNIDLGANKPSGMNISYPNPDPNCAIITWTPNTGGFYKDIQVIAQDDSGQSTKTFTVIVRNGPPSGPGGATITPANPVTTDTLTCKIDDPNSIVNPDPADTIYLDFVWYRVGSATPLATDANVVLNRQNSSTYTRTLDASKTQKGYEIYCRITAHDKDGYAVSPVDSTHVTVLNSPPTQPTSQITPPGPVPNDQSLTCNITGTSTDPDGDTITYKFTWTETTGSGKTYPASPVFSSEISAVLPDSQTEKGDVWKCVVTAKDTDGAQVSKDSNNSVSIANSPPNPPSTVTITTTNPTTTVPLVCQVTPATPTDPDPEDTPQYVYKWETTDGSKQVTGGATLDPSNTVRGEQWKCTVWANDSYVDSNSVVSNNTVTILNSPPTGLAVELRTEGASAIDPNGNTYIDKNLVCVVTTVPSDPDSDTITYTYEWKKAGSATVFRTQTKTDTSDTLPYTETSRGELWYCNVTASDGTDTNFKKSNEVYVCNRAPVINVNMSAGSPWDEGNTYTIQVVGQDADGDALVYEIDPNYTDPNDLQVKDWLQYDPNSHTITATPPAGSSLVNMGFGYGIYKFNFLVTDIVSESPALSITTKKLIQVMVQFPAQIVEDFEYPSNKPTLLDNGWYSLKPGGLMTLKQENASDPNSNHYLQTTTPSTGHLSYSFVKFIDNNVFTYPELRFFIKDTNLYYFEASIRANLNTVEKNYFLRYVPQDPVDQYSVSGNYIIYNIGSAKIDPNGVDVVRNMEQDIFKSTGYHYMYLKDIFLYGNIDYIDDIRVSPGIVDRDPPKDVKNLTALPDEKKVTLYWDLDPNQTEDISGYSIYMDNAPLPADPNALKNYFLKDVGKDVTSYVVTKDKAGQNLINGTTYYFIVKAFDAAPKRNESAGVAISATPQQDTDAPQPPEGLTAASENRKIKLTWKNPSGQDPDLYGYVIYYCDCGVNCSGCYSDTVTAPDNDPNRVFEHFILKDTSGNPLEYGTTYTFTVKARDSALIHNFSDGVKVSHTLTVPTYKLIDNFDEGYAASDTLTQQGWYKLPGTGQFSRKGTADHYLSMTSGYSSPYILNFIIMKWMTNPEDYCNPGLSMLIKSLGDFRVDLYIKGKDGKTYFISYQGDKNANADSGPFTEQVRTYVYKLGWKDIAKDGTGALIWNEVTRDIDDDLVNASKTGTTEGVHFDHIIGIFLRGTMDIDEIKLEQAIADPQNLNARPNDSTVMLSWTVADPNQVENTKLYIGSNLVDPNMNASLIAGTTNDFQYQVSGLTNGTTYVFTVTHVIGGEESKGAKVSATPRAFQGVIETFENISGWTKGWGTVTPEPGFGVTYDSEAQSSVMYLSPTQAYPERFSVSKQVNRSSVTNISLRIKAESDFIIRVGITDDYGSFNIGFVSGGTPGALVYIDYSSVAYYALGGGYTDGEWHNIDKNLNSIINGLFGTNLATIQSVTLGGKIRVDDIGFY